MIKLETGSFHYSLSGVNKFFMELQRLIDQSTHICHTVWQWTEYLWVDNENNCSLLLYLKQNHSATFSWRFCAALLDYLHYFILFPTRPSMQQPLPRIWTPLRHHLAFLFSAVLSHLLLTLSPLFHPSESAFIRPHCMSHLFILSAFSVQMRSRNLEPLRTGFMT